MATVRRCFQGGGIQANITTLSVDIRRVGARLSGMRVGNRYNEGLVERLELGLAKAKEDLKEEQTRMSAHEETCERCAEVRDIQKELRDTTKRNARVAQMLYGPKNDITHRFEQR